MIIGSIFSKDRKVALLLDIGNGTVSIALSIFQKKRNPYVIHVETIPISINFESGIKNISTYLEKIVDEGISRVLKKAFLDSYFKENKLSKKIDEVLISFSSPWFTAKMKEIKINNDKEFIVSESFLSNVLDKETETYLKKSSESEEVLRKGDNFYVEKVVTNSKINGYFLENSLGKKTKSLDLNIYISLVLKKIVDGVKKTILTNTNITEENIHIHTFPFISFSVSNMLFPTNKNYLLMDITSEITDFVLVNNGSLVSISSFPIGRNYIIRQISKVFDVSFEIAESFLRLFINKKTDSNITERIIDILSDVEKEWAIYLEDALLELSPEMLIPGTVYITAEDDVVPIYVDFLNLSKSDNTSRFRKNIQTVRLSKDIMGKLCDFKVGLKQNEFIGILALFFNFIMHR